MANGVLSRMTAGGHEQVAFCHDPASGLRAVIAIWSTALGPSLGGCRFRPYADEAEALADVLRLSKAMGYKNAAAGLDLGGGKAVIIGDPRTDKTEPLLRAFGRFVDSLGGRYLTAEDVGTTQADMDVIRRETPYATGGSPRRGGSGDPSPVTAVGVAEAMHAAAEVRWGAPSLAGRHVAIQGVGKVGRALARILQGEGARLSVADVDADAVARCAGEFGAEIVPPEKIHAVDCDIFSPCALGGILSDRSVRDLQCEVVCGAANNQLESDAIADELTGLGILYVPDFVANAGGVINIAVELDGYDPGLAEERVRGIRATTSTILRRAGDEGITPLAAALALAESRIESVSRLSRIRSTRLRRSR